MTTGLFDVAGKTALVTGATSGIGEMIARGLADAGAHVIGAGRKTAGLAAASERGWTAIEANLSSAEGCRDLAAAVAGVTDRVDIVVHSAGTTWGAPVDEFPDHAWERVLMLNVRAPFVLTQALLPRLTAAANADDPARVVVIGSIDGTRVPPADSYSYSASKAGVQHLVRHLAKTLGPRHITVNTIAPGPFETRMLAPMLADGGREAMAASSPLGRLGEPDDIVGGVLYLTSRAGRYVTGAVLPVDGGISTTL